MLNVRRFASMIFICCSAGYAVSGKTSCYAGTLTAATCSPNSCDPSTSVPTDGGHQRLRVKIASDLNPDLTLGTKGTCPSTLNHGGSCVRGCAAGFHCDPTSCQTTCTAGTMSTVTCIASSCDASAAPANGAKGDCTASLASGATCT